MHHYFSRNAKAINSSAGKILFKEKGGGDGKTHTEGREEERQSKRERGREKERKTRKERLIHIANCVQDRMGQPHLARGHRSCWWSGWWGWRRGKDLDLVSSGNGPLSLLIM